MKGTFVVQKQKRSRLFRPRVIVMLTLALVLVTAGTLMRGRIIHGAVRRLSAIRSVITGQGTFTTHVFTDAQGRQMTYYLYVPAYYNPQQKYPLVLLLHGGGERGKTQSTADQNRQLLLSQPYVQIWEQPIIQDHWPSFIVVPQIIGGTQRWVNVPAQHGSYKLQAEPTTPLLMAKEIVDALQKQYSVDANRLYITGISMGAYGVWDAIERWPHYFAAAAPVAGAGDPSKAAVLKQLPIWDFHGTKDTTVPISGSRQMISAIEAAGGHPHYTEFPGATHVIWTNAYSMPAFLQWFFSQKR
jgi:predicted peptidase